jgi:hypothetical protein
MRCARPARGRGAASQAGPRCNPQSRAQTTGCGVQLQSGAASQSMRPSTTIASTISPDAARGSGVRRAARGTGPSPAALVLPRHALIPAQVDRCRGKRGSRWNSQTFAAVKSAADALPPCAIGQIPLNRLAQAGFEGLARLPAELVRDICFFALCAIMR